MRIVFIVPTVRPDLFQRFMESLCEVLPENYLVAPVFQKYSREQADYFLAAYSGRIVYHDFLADGFPVYPLRVGVVSELYKETDIFINADDDMEFLHGWTDYTGAINKALERQTGVVSCNWVRTESFLAKKRLENRFIKQPVVNMSGGMVFSAKAGKVLIHAPVDKWLFDDVQLGLTLYVAGLENYRYLGSVIIHRIMVKGGLKVLFNEFQHTLNPSKLITLEPCKQVYDVDSNYYMPSSANVTKFAHDLHAKNRALWE